MITPEVALFAAAITLGYFLAVLVLIARVSHWAHQTQERLERTNRLLSMLVKESPPEPARAPGSELG